MLLKKLAVLDGSPKNASRMNPTRDVPPCYIPQMLLLAACTQPTPSGPSDPPPDADADSAWTEAFVWSPATPVPCPTDVPTDDATGELFESLGLTPFEGIPESQYARFGGNVASDPSRLSHFHRLQEDLTELPCFGANLAARADLAVASDHPITAMVADAASDLDLSLTVGGTFGLEGEDPLRSALAALDGEGDTSGVPAELATAVARVLLAAADAATSRDAAFAALSAIGPGGVYNKGPWTWFQGGRALDPDDADTAGLFSVTQDGRAALYEGALRLTQAIDEVDWATLAGLDVDFSADTRLGAVVLRGPADDTWDPAEHDALLFALDTGGDDTWWVPAGANADGDHPVGVAVDLGGDDHYGYVEVPDADDAEGLLPSDADGRATAGSAIGAYSFSETPRQGAGVAGYGLLLDLGGGADTYQSLRLSQGFAAWGVGVCWDDGGSDTYVAEAGAQGSAMAGVAVHYDGGGDDTRRAYTQSQAFGWVLGNGVLYDADGDDDYELVVDDQLVYYSPQTPDTGNSSLGQGTAFGWRRDDTGTHLSGGLALLRDKAGDDAYDGATFVQGVGYWMGTGVLADGAGNDSYDGLFYAEGAAAHFAIGILLDAAGDDRYGTLRDATHSVIGLGHDYSTVALVDGAGNDTYVGVDRSIGAGKCHGLGLFVDRAGDDSYTSDHVRSIGWATDYDWAAETCGTADNIPTYGLFVDLDGTDTYDKPTPEGYGDDRVWINDDLEDPGAEEYGGGLDGVGRDTFARAEWE